MGQSVVVTAVHLPADGGLGQQFADTALMDALQQTEGLKVRRLSVGSARTSLSVDRRLPLGPLNAAPFAIKRAVGAMTYPAGLIHRLDCRLPPGRREVVTVHDLAPLRFADEGDMPRHVGESLRRAIAVVCPSEFSAEELRREYGLGHVHVIGNGIAPEFFRARPLDEPELARLALPARYVLHTGGVTQRKNLAALADAWPIVRKRFPDVGLVMCGPSHVRRTGLFGEMVGVHLLGKVPLRELARLMATAAVVVVPSLYEGYGLPAAEAGACGTPVVAANCGSLPEVVGTHGMLVEPSPAGLAEGLIKSLETRDEAVLHAARKQASTRTWEAAAAAYSRLYRRVLGEEVESRD